MEIICSVSKSFVLGQKEKITIINPFAEKYEKNEALELILNGRNKLKLPTYASNLNCILAGSLQVRNPSCALYSPGLEPREYLATYEAWKGCINKNFVIYAKLPAEFLMDVNETPVTCKRSYLCENERSNMRISENRRIALLGDALVGNGIYNTLQKNGFSVAYEQTISDQERFSIEVAQNGKTGCFTSDELFSIYKRELSMAVPDLVLVVTASFSHTGGKLQKMFRNNKIPVYFLECEIPGFLTEQEKIRLENFLKIN